MAFWLFYLSAVARADIEIEKLTRTIDLKTHVETISSSYVLKNAGADKVQHFYVAFPPEKAKHVALVQASAKDSAGELQATQSALAGSKALPGTLFYKIVLPKALGAGDKATVVVTSSITNTILPFPAQITQDDPQFVRYNGSAKEYSPYRILSQTTQIKLFSSKVESYTQDDAQLQGNTLTYGPFSDVSPFSPQSISIHFENNYPFVTMKTMLKEIEISHWGNIAVEEHYLLAHTGASLKGSFSRFHYQRAQNAGPSFRRIVARLPPRASDIYYRDHIGNISTSHVREAVDHTLFEAEPRFPMFGGWKTDFYTGYNVPAQDFLWKSGSGSHVLNITFGCPFGQAVVDDLTVKVILPEGASNIRWATPFDIDSEGHESRVTYLDTFGRPVLVLKKANVVNAHNQYFQVAYDFPALYSYREPGMLIAAFMAFFVASMVYMRFDLSR